MSDYFTAPTPPTVGSRARSAFLNDLVDAIEDGFDAIPAGLTADDDVGAHNTSADAHGATDAATASKIIKRDASGRAKIANPDVDADITNKGSVDTAIDAEVSPTINVIGAIGGGTQDIDLDASRVVTATVDTSETTFTFSNPLASGRESGFTLYLTNGGSQTVNWPAGVQWPGGVAPFLTAAGLDVLVFRTGDGGTTWQGFASGLDMA